MNFRRLNLLLILMIGFGCYTSSKSFAAWEQKKILQSKWSTESFPYPRLSQALHKVHLYKNQDGRQVLVQSGWAFLIDSQHLLTSILNVIPLGQSPQYSLFVQDGKQMRPCLVKYLDYYNGVVLLFSGEELSLAPNAGDFELNSAATNEPLQLLNEQSKNIQLSRMSIVDDGIREVFQGATTPPAEASLAGSPLINSQNKIAGIYIGKVQGELTEFFLPLSKLTHLFEKARLSPETPPDPSAPLRQFQTQIPAYQEKFIESLLKGPLADKPTLLNGWQMSELPKSLICKYANISQSTRLKCTAKLPLLLDTKAPAFHFELSFLPLQASSQKDLAMRIAQVTESYQKSFKGQSICQQFRLKQNNEDTQLHYCTEKKISSLNLQNSLFRMAFVQNPKNALLVILHVDGFLPAQIKSVLQPLLNKVQRGLL